MKDKKRKSFRLKCITQYDKDDNRSKNENIRNSLIFTLEMFNDTVREIQEFFILCKQEVIKINDNKNEYLIWPDEIKDRLIDRIKQIHANKNINNTSEFYIVNRDRILTACRELYMTLFGDGAKANEHGGWATFLFGKERGGVPDIFNAPKDIDKKNLANELTKLDLYPIFGSFSHVMYDNGKKKIPISNIRFEKDCLNTSVQNFKAWRTWEKKDQEDIEECKKTEKDPVKLAKYNDINDLGNYTKFTYAHHTVSPRWPNYEYKDINRNIFNYYLYNVGDKLFVNLTLWWIGGNNDPKFKDVDIQVAESKQRRNIKVLDKNTISYQDKNGGYVEVKLGGAKLVFNKDYLRSKQDNKNYPGDVYLSITEELETNTQLNPNRIMSVDLGVRNYAAYSITEIDDDNEILEILKSGSIDLDGDKVNASTQKNREYIQDQVSKMFKLLDLVREYKKSDTKKFNECMVEVKCKYNKLHNLTKNNKHNNLKMGISLWSVRLFNDLKKLASIYDNLYNKPGYVKEKSLWGTTHKKRLAHLANIKDNRLKTGCNKIIEIALQYNCKTIVFEDLSKFKLSSYKTARENVLRADWAVGKTKDLLEMTCKFYNIDLKTVHPMYTSQLDNVTGAFGARYNIVNGVYVHAPCGKYFASIQPNGEVKIQNADINASLNIVKIYLYNEKNKSIPLSKRVRYVDRFYKKIGKVTYLKDLHGIYFDTPEDFEKTKFAERIKAKLAPELDKLKVR